MCVSDQIIRQKLWLFHTVALIVCLEIRTITEHLKQRIREVVKSSCNWSVCFIYLFFVCVCVCMCVCTCALTQRKVSACCPVAHERFIFKQLWLLCMNGRTLPRICHHSLLSCALLKKWILRICDNLLGDPFWKKNCVPMFHFLFRTEIVRNNSSLKLITLQTSKTCVLCIIYKA